MFKLKNKHFNLLFILNSKNLTSNKIITTLKQF